MRWILIASLLVCSSVLAAPLDDARSLIDEGNYDEARAILDRTVKNAALESESLILLTRLSNGLEDYESGIRYGKEAVKQSPERSDAHYEYAVALRTKMSKVSKVKAMFSLKTYKRALNTALELAPDNLDAREEQIGFLVNAPGFAGGDKDLAWTRAVELEELDWQAGMRWQAEIQFMREEDEAGVATLREMLERDPSATGARYRLAYWYQSHERYAEADREFATLQEDEEPRIALNALYQRGRTRVLGEYDQQQAIGFLEEYLARLPAEPEGLPGKESAYWRMGNACEQLGRVDDAKKAYQRSLAIKETDEVRKSLKSLDQKR